MSSAKRSKVNLPKGWIVVNSTSFPDRVYYFNVQTGKSSWKEPRDEPNKPEAGKLSQKRKLPTETEKDDIPLEELSGPSSPTVSKNSERRLLRAKRIFGSPKAKETPQMKEMRLKILERKQSKPTQNQKSKSKGLKSETREEKPTKPNRNVKTPAQKRFPKSEGGKEAGKLFKKPPDARNIPKFQQPGGSKSSVSSSSISSTTESTDTTLSSVSKSSKTSANPSQRSIEPPRSTPIPKNRRARKNLALTRLDSLRKDLNVERKKIEPVVAAKIVKHMLAETNKPETCYTSSDPKNQNTFEDKAPKSPIEVLPSISEYAKSRFKMLKARVTTNSTLPDVRITKDNEKSDKPVPKGPKIAKRNIKAGKKGGKGVTAKTQNVLAVEERAHASKNRSVFENQVEDTFCEEMEWEPIEEEKVISEIQEVRTQLSTDQGTQPNLPNCSIDGLDLSHASQDTDKRILYIVIDTNVYLSNLKMVANLLEEPGKSNRHYKPVVVVPWTVLQELDYIKDNKSRTKSAHLQKSAKTAVSLLFEYFSSKHPRLKGQTAGDAALNRMKFQVESPDDEILQSCLQIRELGYKVVLLSNDKNLCNKAIIHDIQTYGRQESIDEMLSQSNDEPQSRSCGDTSRTIDNRREIVDSKEAEISDDIFCEAKALIKHFLSAIVSKEMENLYGENWKKYTIIQPPWSVIDVLKCASKHWIAAISDVFVKQAESMIGKLSNMFSNAPKYGQSLRYVNEVLEACSDLVQMIKSKDYQDLSAKTCYDIKELTETCKEKLRGLQGDRVQSEASIGVENNNLNEGQRADKAFKYFDQIWTFTNNFCGLAADLAGIPHTITYKRLDPPLPPEMINRMQPELVFSLNQLIHALRTVLNDDEYLTMDHPALIGLYQILVNYFANSGELNDRRSLDIVDLLCCVRVKKEILKIGLVQLQELCYQFCRIADLRSTINTSLT